MNRIRILAPILYVLIALVAGQIPLPAHAERVRDLGQFEGLRANQLAGALVPGLGAVLAAYLLYVLIWLLLNRYLELFLRQRGRR